MNDGVVEGDEKWTLGHRPTLDGLRAIAVLLVLVCHTILSRFQAAGPAGVTMFFTLSGFLITSLLLDERARTGRISLRQFYWRRALRLLPALVLYLLTMAVFARVSQAGTAPSASDFAGALFYVSNYTTAMQGADNVLVHTWSLAVEEQFYIAWPLIMIAVLTLTRGLRVLAGVAVTGTLVAITLRILLWDGGAGADRIYYGTDTHMDGLLVGCLGAIWIRRGPSGRNHPALAAGCLAVTAALSVGNDVVRYLLVPTLVPLLVIAAILALVQQPQERLLTNPVLRWVGRRSYAIYLWHFPLFGAAASVSGPSTWPALVLALALTLAIAHLSWRCVEEPFLALKSRGIPNRKISTDKSVEGLATSSPSI